MSKIVNKILATSVVIFFSTAPTSLSLLIFFMNLIERALVFDLLGFCFSHLFELFIHFLLCFGNHSSNADSRCQKCNHLCVASCCICSLCCPSRVSLLHLYFFHGAITSGSVETVGPSLGSSAWKKAQSSLATNLGSRSMQTARFSRRT